jgi:hypothetical protein
MQNNFFDPDSKKSINQKFREKRFEFFKSLLEKMKSDKTIQILDIGGTEIYWERMGFPKDENVHITLLNLDLEQVKNKKFTSVKGDACSMPEFRDKQFDIVFSNSVIEHLFSLENQKRMADEVRRVGKAYSIQTPNRYFPIEPHWLFPFFQFLPFSLKVAMTKNLNLGHYKKSVSKAAAIKRVNEVKLLTEKQMKNLFPDGKVYKEKFFGLTKSVTMFDFPEFLN